MVVEDEGQTDLNWQEGGDPRKTKDDERGARDLVPPPPPAQNASNSFGIAVDEIEPAHTDGAVVRIQ